MTTADPTAATPDSPTERALAAESLCLLTSEFHARGWCLGTSGNFSVTLETDPLELLITRSGCHKERLEPADMVVVGHDGRTLAGETGKPSAEALLHATVVASTRARSVLHTHTVWNTLLGQHHCAQGGFLLTGYEMLKGLEGIESHRAEVFVPVFENSQDMQVLSAKVADLLAPRADARRAHGFLIAGHGLYTWGATHLQARRHVEIFEFLFECEGRKTRFQTDNHSSEVIHDGPGD